MPRQQPGYVGISRKTLHKYLKRVDEAHLKSLEEHSKAPIKKRGWTVTPVEEKRVPGIRNSSKCKWGQENIKRHYLKLYVQVISTNTAQKIINKLNLYADTTEHLLRLKRRRQRKKRILITNFEKKPCLGYLWHTYTDDHLVVWSKTAYIYGN